MRQRLGPAQNQSSDPVSLELALSGDGKLDQHRSDRSQQQQAELGDRVSALVVTAAAEHEQVREIAECTGNAGCHGRDQHVPVLDVGQLVGNDPLELLLRHILEDARGHRHHRMTGTAAGREGVGLFVGRYSYLGHRKSGPLSQPVHHGVKLGRLLRVYHLRSVHPEHQTVGEEVHRRS